MTRGDLLIERGAERLDQLARQAAAKGGFAAKLADELAEDAAFLRKLKPSLIAARARGEAATNAPPGHEPAAPSAPQMTQPRAQPKTKSGRPTSGPNPFLVIGAALAAGVAVAKLIDWRSHAHPRD